MIHRAKPLYGCSLAAAYEGHQEPLGTYFIEPVLANASKIHEGREMAETIRLMVDIAGGFVADLPSDRDLGNAKIGPQLKRIRFWKGVKYRPVFFPSHSTQHSFFFQALRFNLFKIKHLFKLINATESTLSIQGLPASDIS